MSLTSKLASFKKEQADATSRNISHSRPASSIPARVPTPKPAATVSAAATSATDNSKRTHEAAFSSTGNAGSELLTNVNFAKNYLKSKHPQALPFEEIIRHLSLPNDAQGNKPLIRQALFNNERVEVVPKGTDGATKESFRYRPKVPVSNGEELKDYLARQDSARGVAVADLKDGWPDCVNVINQLEEEGSILVIRQKKENIPKMVYTDSASYHIKVDQEFREFWLKTKLPQTEGEIRTELEKAGITPTSQVKETKKTDMRAKERKRPSRRGGKVTNSHMIGRLKDYSKR